METQRRRTVASWIALYALVCVAAILAHGAALQSGFVFDDDRLLLENIYVKQWGGLKVLLSHSLFSTSPLPFEGAYYRPLASVSYWLTWHLFKDNAAWHHALNIGLHAIVALLLAWVLTRYGVRRRIACASAFLFAAHPVTAEIVDYVGGRQDLMGWAITLLCMGLLVGRTKRWHIMCIGFAGTLLPIFCREYFVASAFMLITASAFAAGPAMDKRRIAACAAGAGAAVAANLALRSAMGIPRIPFSSLITNDTPRVLWGTSMRLFKIVLIPTDVSSGTSIAPTSPVAGVAVGLLLTATLTGVIWFLRRSRPHAVLGTCGAVAVACSVAFPLFIAQTEWVLGDRYGYETLVGAALLATAVADHVLPVAAEKLRTPAIRYALLLAPFAAALAFMPLTRSRAFCYQDEEVLAECDAETRPGDPLVQLRRSQQLLSQGALDRAFPYCIDYLKRAPERRLHVADCIGSYLLLHGDAKASVPFFRDIAYARPRWVQSRKTYFLSLALAGEPDLAEQEIRRWEKSFPDAADLIESRVDVQSIRRGKRPPLSYQGLKRASRN